MKKIGFADLYISEWHANHYPEWLAQANERLGGDFEVCYAWAKEYVSPVDGKNTDEWCKEFKIERCQTLEELCEKSDYILILAPSNPEAHLSLAETVFKYGKPVYVDKTFAPDLDTAKKIFAIAEKNGVKFFSTSALRYSFEMDVLTDPKVVVTLGGGLNAPEYIIHQIEMVVRTVDATPLEVKVERAGDEYFTTVHFENGIVAQMNYGDMFPFAFHGEQRDGTKTYAEIQSATFPALMDDILKFFTTGNLPFDSIQTLRAIAIRDGFLAGCEKLGQWIKLEK